MGVDITGPFINTSGHQKYAMTMVNYVLNFPKHLLATAVWSTRFIRWLESLLSHYVDPAKPVSDNGPQFISTEFSNFLKHHGTEHIQSAENGLAEDSNWVLKFGTQCFCTTVDLLGKRD